jgi:4-hydroxybenzoate polyprenyltransferase
MGAIMGKILDYVNLLRIRQWYKNLVIFLPIFFIGQLFQLTELYLVGFGFLSLCLASSANYVFNDLKDLKKDQLHPEKRSRPLASGNIKKYEAIILTLLLYLLSLLGAYLLTPWFFGAVAALVVIAQVYTLFLKNILFADILTIAALFVIRAVSGAFLINSKISPWLVLCPFFLSLFLSVGKRHSEMLLLKEKAGETRVVLQEYTPELTNSLMIISTALLVVSYALYSFLSEHNNLLITLPFALFVIFRFYYLIGCGSIIGRHPEKVITDKAMVIGITLWTILTAGLIYFQ